jgi:hypothetical protein
MPRSLSWLSGVGLVLGLFLGCKGPSGVSGLCDTLSACGSANFADLADCLDSVGRCDDADERADLCLARNGCEEFDGCARDLAVECADDAPPDTTGEPTEAPTSDPPASTTDADSSTTTGPVDPVTSSGPDDPGTADDATTDPPGTTTDPTGVSPAEQCKMMADPMTACSDCICDNCREKLQACADDEGCTAIRMCAEETGCMGIGCIAACGDVIDMHGGVNGPGATIGLQLNMCLDQHCSDECSG